MTQETLQLGGMFAIAYSLIELVKFIINKYTKNGGGRSTEKNSEAILAELITMNNNHLHSLEIAINNGNEKMTKAIADGNMKVIEILGEIKGNLQK